MARFRDEVWIASCIIVRVGSFYHGIVDVIESHAQQGLSVGPRTGFVALVLHGYVQDLRERELGAHVGPYLQRSRGDLGDFAITKFRYICEHNRSCGWRNIYMRM